MNAGPSGFGHAPVSKGIIFASVGASLLSHVARITHRRLPAPVAVASQAAAFRAPGELLFGCLLLYYFRVFERQCGSAKFGAYASAVTGLSYIIQMAVSRLFHLAGPLPPAPLPLIFASFVPFLLDIPPSSKFSFMGWSFTDKVFVYLAGAQLLLSGGRRSLIVAAASLTAGVLYRINFLNIRRLRLPGVVTGFMSRVFGPLLIDGRTAPVVVATGGGGATAAGPSASSARHAARQVPTSVPAAATPARLVQPSQEALDALLNMGFEHSKAVRALQQANNDLQAAISLLL
eukprot:jgi/Chrzof1/10142/Cz04g30140.t1